MTERAAIILAAGQGTRMRSPRPKVLHPVGGRAMLDRAIDVAEALGCGRILVVAGAHAPAVVDHAKARLGSQAVVIQDPPLGTGHAVRAAEGALAGYEGDVVVTYADTPLLEAESMRPLFQARDQGAELAVLGFQTAAPGAYGRLVLGSGASLDRIVEARDASAEILAITACNSGVLAAHCPLLFDWLRQVRPNNVKGEFYLTDVVGIARARGCRIDAVFTGESRVLGVNSQAELVAAEAQFQRDRRDRALEEGVCMPAPHTVMFAFDTELEQGVVVEPYVVFGPGVRVETGAHIRAFSHLEGAQVHSGAIVGPYARLRPGAEIGVQAHVGNFVEVKQASLGRGAKANHLAYIGDGSVGAGANIGAGVIFCNYDGFDKHRTEVGDNAFVGSDCALVAPLTIGAGAYVGSGSVITNDVAADALALERGPQVEKLGWAARFRARKQLSRKPVA